MTAIYKWAWSYRAELENMVCDKGESDIRHHEERRNNWNDCLVAVQQGRSPSSGPTIEWFKYDCCSISRGIW